MVYFASANDSFIGYDIQTHYIGIEFGNHQWAYKNISQDGWLKPQEHQ